MKAIIYLLLVVCLVSCNYELNLDEVDTKEKLVLYCFPSNSDTTIIQLSKSVPIGQKYTSNTRINNADINLTVNGKAQNIYWNEDSTTSLPAQCYYALGKWTKDDIIQLRANVEHLPAITAQTSIPDKFPLKEIRLEPLEGSSNIMQVQVTFKDNATTNDYYGIRLVKKEINRMDDEELVSFHSVEFDLKEEPLLNNQADLDEIFMFSNKYFQNLYIWKDEKNQGQEYTLHLAMDYQKDFDVEWSDHSYKAEYKIYLYALSPEYFKYLQALNKINSNDLGSHGFSSIPLNFSNVSGGIGVIGGYQISETEWLKNLRISQN